MTNKEKAQKIAEKTIGDAATSFLGYINEMSVDFCKWSAEEMAEWKDQQFKEYLEKNRTNYPDFMNGTDTYAFGMKEGYVKAFDRIINELFKED